MEILKLGKGRTLTLPEEMCQQLKMDEGEPFAVSIKDGCIEISPIIERFTPERIAEFLMNKSCDEEEYRQNLADVVAMGVDPTAINPDYLCRDQPWQSAEAHQDILARRGR